MNRKFFIVLLSNVLFPLLVYMTLVWLSWIMDGGRNFSLGYISQYVLILFFSYWNYILAYCLFVLCFEALALLKLKWRLSAMLISEWIAVSVVCILLFLKYASVVIVIIWLAHGVSQYFRGRIRL